MVSIVLIPFVWAFCEATFFFIVPDVWLTWLVFSKRSGKQLSTAVLYATCGAILGGMVVYTLGANLSREVIVGWFDHIPGISQALIEKISGQVDRHGVLSYWKGMWGGNPYKVYAALWGARGGDLTLWILSSGLARAVRFILTISLAALINHYGEKFIKNWEQRKSIVFVVFWVCFYSLYFSHFRN